MMAHDLDKYPLVQELPSGLSVEQAFLRLADKPHCVFLDSSLRHDHLGRFSFLAADPYDVIDWAGTGDRGVEPLRSHLVALRSTIRHDLPPFQGGAAGVFTYEFGQQFEKLPTAASNEFRLPFAFVGLYDTVIAFDHRSERAWIISQGFPEQNDHDRYARARTRLEEFRRWLDEPIVDRLPFPIPSERVEIQSEHVPVRPTLGIYSNFSADTYCDSVAQAIEYIYAGDAFQINISQRLLRAATATAVQLYLKLRKRSPATFAGYLDAGDWQVVSASPERFVHVKERMVEVRPIKGTRRHFRRAEADLFAGDELQASAKDRAENVMIVDLMRNDLSRVCLPDSVHVSQLCGLEAYGYVTHLVSVVGGRLRQQYDAIDLLAAAFPGGSITGAPKLRAMEIISELERVVRGSYCGSLGYIGWDGSMDLNILIRTITAAGGWWQFPVGGGVVAGSTPAAEYAETWHKAAGILSALESLLADGI